MRSTLPVPTWAAIPLFMLCLMRLDSPAGSINMYDRLSNPRAITRLSGDDVAPLRFHSGIAYRAERDTVDGFQKLAWDSGCGIITHIWFTYNRWDTISSRFKLWVDDSCIFNSMLIQFFDSAAGVFRRPLNGLGSGGLFCEVQIPYHRNFRITFDQWNNPCCIYWNIEWRPVRDSTLLDKYAIVPSVLGISEQQRAEAMYNNAGDPWLPDTALSLQAALQIPPHGTTSVASLTGPGVIKELHFLTASLDTAMRHALQLRIYWDGSPHPSVDVPLADFFGTYLKTFEINALQLRTDSVTGSAAYFPMPFAVGARVELVNNSDAPITLQTSVVYSKEPVDRSTTGYFAAQFHEANPTHYHIFYPVARALGRGHYIGVMLSLLTPYPPWFLEGDPRFAIDSSASNFIWYTGAEDYFDGGFYFMYGPFSIPFAGCPERFTTMYRFHYLDCIDFDTSLDFYWQTGVSNDCPVHLRSVAYLYRHWTPFWTDRDTIAHDQSWTIGGSGYAPHQAITAMLGGDSVAITTADGGGAFNATVTVPAAWTAGSYALRVNNDTMPEPIVVTRGTTVRFVKDSIPDSLMYNDSLLVIGTGFQPGETVTIFLDTIAVRSSFRVDAEYQFTGLVRVPYLDSGAHVVKAVGNMGSRATCDSLLHVTRTFNIEFEYLPWQAKNCSPFVDYIWYTPGFWSNGLMITAYNDTLGASIQFTFNVSVADTYHIQMFGNTGVRFGKYTAVLDSLYSTDLNFYGTADSNSSWRAGPFDLGVHHLAQGAHTLRFISIGQDTAAIGMRISADNLQLIPATPYQLSRVTHVASPMPLNDELLVYPNPTSSASLTVMLGSQLSLAPRTAIEIVDLFGAVVAHQQIEQPGGAIEVPLPSLPNGLYFCRVRSADATGATLLRPFTISR